MDFASQPPDTPTRDQTRGAPRSPETRRVVLKRKSPPSLRPPTLMIDLLFGALMLFAFQMGDPNSQPVIPKDFELPTSNENAPKKQIHLLALKPSRNASGQWVYELPTGQRLSAEGVAKALTAEARTPVLLVPHDARVQSFIDAEQPLRRLGIKAGLAVATIEGGPQ
jgi:hypothetical protein